MKTSEEDNIGIDIPILDELNPNPDKGLVQAKSTKDIYYVEHNIYAKAIDIYKDCVVNNIEGHWNDKCEQVLLSKVNNAINELRNKDLLTVDKLSDINKNVLIYNKNVLIYNKSKLDLIKSIIDVIK
jgi:hypothetical protein